MRRPRAVWIGSTAILLATFSNSAAADVNPSPTPMTTLDSYKVTMEQFKKDRELYFVAVRERVQNFRIINRTFDLAIREARRDSKLAMQSALKPEEKSAVNSNLRSVIANAIIDRERAINALGEPPTPPTQPGKPPKNLQGEKIRAEKKRR